VRDLDDALLLMDPRDPDPFWNRLASLRWPDGIAAFDRRLAEAISLFGVLDRRPHLWPSPAWNRPADLAARLLAHGFQDVGGGHLMVLDGPADRMRARSRPGTEVVLVRRADPPAVRSWAAREAASVLIDAFGADPARADRLAVEWERALADDRVAVTIASLDGEPAAVAKTTTFDGATYLSSIGTRAALRGRGLGALVTLAAMANGAAEGGRVQYLGVHSGNRPAIRLYERLGFVSIGEAPDLVLTT
jgi:ribosomal protein S18 acetylase RimI-like enzyme